jgi:tRNA threonylcarbamoyladenosine biosynthesis protein TsaE
MTKTHDYISHSPADTWKLAARLLADLPERSVLALHGDLGSGKTCFVQGLAHHLGIPRPITSPTFTVVNEYREGKRPLFHFDLYRLATPDDVLMLGFEEYLEVPGIMAIEWPERAAGLLPAHTLHLHFQIPPAANEHTRHIRMEEPS